MKDFVRVLPKQGHDISILNEFSRLFHEAEYQTVIQGTRKAGTIHISQDNLDTVIPKLNKNSLVFTPLRKSGYYQGFAHTHREVKPGDPFYWYGCITRGYEDGQSFLKADKESDHKKIGALLGFPECCTQYFSETFSKNFDPVWVNESGNLNGFPECNQMLRYFGARITSHLSCSPVCQGTKKIGELWTAVMRGINAELTGRLLEYLARPMTWDSYHGVVQVDTPDFVGLTHTFPIKEHRLIRWNQNVVENSEIALDASLVPSR